MSSLLDPVEPPRHRQLPRQPKHPNPAEPPAHRRVTVMVWVFAMKSAARSLLANKMRTGLAMFGVTIGVGAVIAMLAIGAGAQAKVMQRINKMGTSLLIVRPTQRGTGGVMSGTQQNLTVADALALRSLPGVALVSPTVRNSTQVKHMDLNCQAAINGVSPVYFQIRNFEFSAGTGFTDRNCDDLDRVVVLGPITASRLFHDEYPIGKVVKINGINFTVVGVTAPKASGSWAGPDDEAFVPYSTAMKILFGLKYLHEMDISGRPGYSLDALSGEPKGDWHLRKGAVHEEPPPVGSIAELLRRRHRLLPDEPDDFKILNQSEILETAMATTMVFRILLGSIAAISLLVGGIGIMNIMLVTVIERTREIGTRKAIGARANDILLQFVLESTLLSGIGGVLGAVVGIGGAKVIPLLPRFHDFLTIVEPQYVAISVGFACVVGITFGVYPAWRASRMDAIEALRYE